MTLAITAETMEINWPDLVVVVRLGYEHSIEFHVLSTLQRIIIYYFESVKQRAHFFPRSFNMSHDFCEMVRGGYSPRICSIC